MGSRCLKSAHLIDRARRVVWYCEELDDKDLADSRTRKFSTWLSENKCCRYEVVLRNCIWALTNRLSEVKRSKDKRRDLAQRREEKSKGKLFVKT